MSEVPHPDADPLGLYAASAHKSSGGDPARFAAVMTWLAFGMGLVVFLVWWNQPAPPVTAAQKIPLNTTKTIQADTSAWQTLYNSEGTPAVVSVGDKICASGEIFNRYYTDHGKMIPIGVKGIPEKDIRSYTAYDYEMPLMSLMYQFDNDIKTRGYFNAECINVQRTGQRFQMMVNIPYHDIGGFATTGIANTSNFGSWTITRVER